MTHLLWHLIARYGYFAVAAGCFFEGEAAILLGVLAAHQGLLSEHYVWISATVGTVLGDNIWFHGGHWMGRLALAKRPQWKAKTARVENLLKRYGASIMIGFRFIYAIRAATPFALGTLGVSPWRFLFYDVIATLIWSSLITVIATYVASFISEALAHIQNAEQGILAAVLAAVVVGTTTYYLRRRRARKRRYTSNDTSH
jgi:membrane protein DedA with SNARE-associated domain